MSTQVEKQAQHVQNVSKNSDTINNDEKLTLTEKARFMQIIQTHHNYLVELKQQRSAKLLREHRSRIIMTTQGQLYASYLDKHLTYKEFRSCIDFMRDLLSWEKITGVKQLSIFDDYTLNDNV